MTNARTKSWTFTLNNYTEQHEQVLQQLAESEICTYLLYGREIGEQGTPHLQGYAVFSVRKRLQQVRGHLPGNPHVEPAMGSPGQNRTYCIKDGDFVEIGTCPSGQGTRSDLNTIRQRIDNGITLSDIADEFTRSYFRYSTGIEKYYFLKQKPRTWKTQVYVYYGLSGTGKTRTVHENVPNDLYVHSGSTWFDGYDQQETALFDDFGGSEFKITYLLKLLDRYECKVQVKGGMRQWKPKVIYITSNKEPMQWFPNAYEEHRLALWRRLDKVILFKQNDERVTIKDNSV